jgi:CDP-diacylglycerol--glycerol-3-phosphate 3-phosphatidyltransferase
MSDGDFLRSLQDRSIPGGQFHHGDHLRLAWLLLELLPFEEALDATRRTLQNFALRTGSANHYHETITRGWLLLLASQEGLTFQECVDSYPQGENPLLSFWSQDVLQSEAARTGWVPPDLADLPPVSPHWKPRVTPRTRRTTRLQVDPLPDNPQLFFTLTEPQAGEPDRRNPEESPKAASRSAASRARRARHATLERETNRTMSSGFTWTSAFGKYSGWLLQKIVNGLALSKISPNTLTFIGLIINIVAAFFFGYARGENAHRMFFYAGLILIGAGLFDMVDGRVARLTNQVSVFGAFFDSVMDRYSDVAMFFGLLVFYARGNRFQYVVLVAFVMTASLMISYTRARAEALIGQCKVGFMERPERIVLVILGALCDRWGVMAPALWVLAFLCTVTVIHRIRYTYTETERRKLVPATR